MSRSQIAIPALLILTAITVGGCTNGSQMSAERSTSTSAPKGVPTTIASSLKAASRPEYAPLPSASQACQSDLYQQPTGLAEPDKPLVTVDPSPSDVVFIWYPGANAHPCRVAIEHEGRQLAERLAQAVRTALPFEFTGAISCPADVGEYLYLYFIYSNRPQAELVILPLTGCNFYFGTPERASRSATNLWPLVNPLRPKGFPYF